MLGTQTNAEAISVSRTSRSHFWTIFIHGCVNSLQIGLLFLEFYLFLAVRWGNRVVFQNARVLNYIIPLLGIHLIIEEACFINMSTYAKKAGPRKEQCSSLSRWGDRVGKSLRLGYNMTQDFLFCKAHFLHGSALTVHVEAKILVDLNSDAFLLVNDQPMCVITPPKFHFSLTLNSNPSYIWISE